MMGNQEIVLIMVPGFWHPCHSSIMMCSCCCWFCSVIILFALVCWDIRYDPTFLGEDSWDQKLPVNSPRTLSVFVVPFFGEGGSWWFGCGIPCSALVIWQEGPGGWNHMLQGWRHCQPVSIALFGPVNPHVSNVQFGSIWHGQLLYRKFRKLCALSLPIHQSWPVIDRPTKQRSSSALGDAGVMKAQIH